MKSCFSINVFMPDIIMEYGNQVFDNLKQEVEFSKHFTQRSKERNLSFDDINSYSICELYFDGIKIKDIAIYKHVGDGVIIAYISVNSRRLKTIFKTNEYTFLNSGRNKRFNETIPKSLYELFHASRIKKENSKYIKTELMNLSNIMKREMQILMDNFDNMTDDAILETVKYYNELWKHKKQLRSMN